MRKLRAAKESIAANQGDGIYSELDSHLSAINDIFCLRTYFADNLIWPHEYAFEYKKCKFNSTLEVALTIKSKSINGEISSAY
jgi:hypothetical protein